MKKFTCVEDIGDLRQAVAEALEIKHNRFQYTGLGRNRTLLMLFFNSSLRTRLSTQKAAMNLGMNVMVLDVNQEAWKLETERGVVMDGDKAEHLLEAIPVMGSYCAYSITDRGSPPTIATPRANCGVTAMSMRRCGSEETMP